jgi:hypothetical protein
MPHALHAALQHPLLCRAPLPSVSARASTRAACAHQFSRPAHWLVREPPAALQAAAVRCERRKRRTVCTAAAASDAGERRDHRFGILCQAGGLQLFRASVGTRAISLSVFDNKRGTAWHHTLKHGQLHCALRHSIGWQHVEDAHAGGAVWWLVPLQHLLQPVRATPHHCSTPPAPGLPASLH